MSSSRIRLLLFDIDGTLITKDKIKTKLMNGVQLIKAMESKFQTKLQNHPNDISKLQFAGGTDQSIAFDVLKHVNFIDEKSYRNPSAELVKKVDEACRDSGFGLKATIEQGDYVYKRLPMVNELLERLAVKDKNCRIALLTGNYAVNAKLKLQGADISTNYFQFDKTAKSCKKLELDDQCDPAAFSNSNTRFIGSFGSDSRVRRELPPIACNRFREILGHDNFDAIIIGDTPKDIDCAHFNGLKAIGVATGPFSTEELLEAGADRVLEDFKDLDKTVDCLLAEL